jgi:RNA recognition motif-containing protein
MDIYVGNFSIEIEEDSLKVLFKVFGEVESVKIIKDRETGKSKGFGFVNMLNSIEAQRAIDELNNIELAGRRLVVYQAIPKENKPEIKPEKAEVNPDHGFKEDVEEKTISFKIQSEKVEGLAEYSKILTPDGFVKIKFKS